MKLLQSVFLVAEDFLKEYIIYLNFSNILNKQNHLSNFSIKQSICSSNFIIMFFILEHIEKISKIYIILNILIYNINILKS